MSATPGPLHAEGRKGDLSFKQYLIRKLYLFIYLFIQCSSTGQYRLTMARGRPASMFLGGLPSVPTSVLGRTCVEESTYVCLVGAVLS